MTALTEAAIEAARQLDRAADYIEQNGWHQGGYYNSNTVPEMVGWSPQAIVAYSPPACAEGAIALANGYKYWPGFQPAIRQLRLLLTDDPRSVRRPIPDWNDADGRTQDEVVATLRKAAEQARAGS